MEDESEKQEDQSANSLEYEAAKEKQLRALKENWTYFECKNCFCTITHEKTNQDYSAENMDPNKPHSGICKSCVANQKFQKSLPAENHLNQSSSSSTGNIVSEEADDDEQHDDNRNDDCASSVLSPLTTTPSTSNNKQPTIKEEEGFLFQVGTTHRAVFSAKPPAHKTGNYAGMNLYMSKNVFDTDFERLFNIEGANEKRIDKFFAGVDVIYKKNERKTFSCDPLLCPAKVFYDDPVSSKTECEVVVGILLDGHNSAIPIVAVYDSFRTLKNLAKSRAAIHGMFTRLQPSSIQHDFSSEELTSFSKHLFTFLNVKSSLEEKEGKFVLGIIINRKPLLMIMIIIRGDTALAGLGRRKRQKNQGNN
jgi:hypothetical protein